MYRNHTKKIRIGDLYIGGGQPVLLQSMTNTVTADKEATITQILKLEEAGCDLIRCAVTNNEDAEAIPYIKKAIHIPFIADIQFDYRLAIASIMQGADKIRINPGNIGSGENVKKVVDTAKEHDIPIRVGVNSGSLEKDILRKYGGVTPEALVESALRETETIQDLGYDNLVVSIKTTDPQNFVRAHELIADKCPYPLHVGLTESGTSFTGAIRSAVTIGTILNEGIGDTIRVSLTGDVLQEIHVGKEILRTAGLRKSGITVFSCPTCGRTKIDLPGLANNIESLTRNLDLNLKVAVMGCAVNGPGEAKEADIGIAGGIKEGLLIKKGKIIKKLPENELIPALMEELLNWNKSEQ